MHKKEKKQKTPPIYKLTNDDMDKNGYQVRDVAKEIV
jgi:hypothetical protein